MHALALIDDPLFSLHRPDGPHPERAERLDAARAALAKESRHGLPRIEVSAQDATEEQLGRVHGEGYLLRLGHAAGKRGCLDPDTYWGSCGRAGPLEPPRDHPGLQPSAPTP